MLTVKRNGIPHKPSPFHSLPGITEVNQPVSNSKPITNPAIKQKLETESGRKRANKHLENI